MPLAGGRRAQGVLVACRGADWVGVLDVVVVVDGDDDLDLDDWL
jgi:hypothetical protein